MKVCSKCKQSKPFDSFYKQARKKDGLQAHCKICANKATTRSEWNNREKYNKIRRKVKDKLRDEIRDYKASHGCLHCGESDPICLDLHHLDPTVKDLNPSNAMGRKIFYEEANKCIVLCANCHRKEHERLRNI